MLSWRKRLSNYICADVHRVRNYNILPLNLIMIINNEKLQGYNDVILNVFIRGENNTFFSRSIRINSLIESNGGHIILFASLFMIKSYYIDYFPRNLISSYFLNIIKEYITHYVINRDLQWVCTYSLFENSDFYAILFKI